MSGHSSLFVLNQIAVLFQFIGSLLLLGQAYLVRKFGETEPNLLGIGRQDEISLDATGPILYALIQETKSQFKKQLPGFALLFFGMALQATANFMML